MAACYACLVPHAARYAGSLATQASPHAAPLPYCSPRRTSSQLASYGAWSRGSGGNFDGAHARIDLTSCRGNFDGARVSCARWGRGSGWQRRAFRVPHVAPHDRLERERAICPETHGCTFTSKHPPKANQNNAILSKQTMIQWKNCRHASRAPISNRIKQIGRLSICVVFYLGFPSF